MQIRVAFVIVGIAIMAFALRSGSNVESGAGGMEGIPLLIPLAIGAIIALVSWFKGSRETMSAGGLIATAGLVVFLVTAPFLGFFRALGSGLGVAIVSAVLRFVIRHTGNSN